MNNNNIPQIDYNDYDFVQIPGTGRYRLAGKAFSKNGYLNLFLDGSDGGKRRGVVYPNTNFLGMQEVSVGSFLNVTFVASGTGRVYIKSIDVERTV